MCMIIKKTTHIDLIESAKAKVFLENKGLKLDVDFRLEEYTTEHEQRVLMTLFPKAIEVFEEIAVHCYLICLAKSRHQSKYDVCETFVGTTAKFDEYIQRYSKEEYAVWHISK